MNIEEAIIKLRSLNQKVPKPLRLPTEVELSEIEQTEDINFSTDYRKYLLEAGDVVVGSLEPTNYTNPNYHVFYKKVFQHARNYGIPKSEIPICEDNSDFYCVSTDGKVRFWSHDFGDFTGESWDSMSDWIARVWIDGE